MLKAFRFEQAGEETGILYFDLQGEKVNKFNTAVMQELADNIEQLSKKNDLKCLLLMSKKPGTFIAGADVKEIKDIDNEDVGYEVAKKGQEIFNKFETWV